MFGKFKRKSDKADMSNVSSELKNETFIPLATRAQIYANELTNAINVNELDERISIQITPTISTIKFEKTNVTYVKIFNGVWKQL